MLRCSRQILIRGGFGSIFHSESLPGALPQYQNSPQKTPYGLYAELLSGTAFTVPRALNRFTWVYRKRPSVCHHPVAFAPLTTSPGNWSDPILGELTPEPYRFRPIPSEPADFIDGIFTLAVNSGGAASVYSFNKPSSRIIRNLDAEMLILPESGNLRIITELGRLEVGPLDMVLIPRGMAFRVHAEKSAGSFSKGYILENNGENFVLPELGPIGASSGLASARHFEAPDASTEPEGEAEVVIKMSGNFFTGKVAHNPFDVVAWYGSLTPLKYDMRLFMPINSVAFDHPDPSIGCVLQSLTPTVGVSNLDFVIFPPRWMVAENTFRPPWFHRNVMSEFMGLLKGEYDAKAGDGFVPGSSSIHNQMIPHGPDAGAVEAGLHAHTGKQQRYENTFAFMFESDKIWTPTKFALEKLKDREYVHCWDGIQNRFDGNFSAQHLPFNPDKQVIF